MRAALTALTVTDPPSTSGCETVSRPRQACAPLHPSRWIRSVVYFRILMEETDLGFIPTVLNEGVVDMILGGVPFFRMCNNEARVAVLA